MGLGGGRFFGRGGTGCFFAGGGLAAGLLRGEGGRAPSAADGEPARLQLTATLAQPGEPPMSSVQSLTRASVTLHLNLAGVAEV